MNDWLKKVTEKIKSFWKDSSVAKKAIFIGVIALVIVIFVVTATVSSSDTMVSVFTESLTDENDIIRITNLLDSKNVDYRFDKQNGKILVKDKKTASYWKSNLSAEGLVPSYIDPYKELKREWSTTDADQNIKIKQAVQKQLKNYLENIEDISSANVILVLPEENLFKDAQKPVKASVTLNLKTGSTLASEKKRIQGVESLILSAVNGLEHENLSIADNKGNILNDFEGMADFDRLSRIEKELKIKSKEEKVLAEKTLQVLQTLVSSKRVKETIVSIDMDFSKKESQSTEYSPIVIKGQDPSKPYDTTETRDYLPISSKTVTKTFEGTAFNPEGPAGIEGQNPPTYIDNSNTIGKSTETGVEQNNVINTTYKKEEYSPQVGRRSISAFIDGVWEIELDENGNQIWEGRRRKRKCTLVDDKTLEKWAATIFVGTGCSSTRGDKVTLTSYEADHTDEWALEDEKELKAQQMRKTVLMVLGVIAVVLVGFILFRVISKEIERRKRLREEELLRKQQADREQALWAAQDDANMNISMSVEESRRAELLENAINLAKEHPEDVALLIRTWLMEE